MSREGSARQLQVLFSKLIVLFEEVVLIRRMHIMSTVNQEVYLQVVLQVSYVKVIDVRSSKGAMAVIGYLCIQEWKSASGSKLHRRYDTSILGPVTVQYSVTLQMQARRVFRVNQNWMTR